MHDGVIDRVQKGEFLQTVAPQSPTILFDGHCRFCTTQMERLARWLPRGRYQALSFQEPGVLERFPGITHERAMRAMIFIDKGGCVYDGMQAIVCAVQLRPLGKVAALYYVPGIRQLLDAVYRRVAANRYRLMSNMSDQDCDGGTCALHVLDRGAGESGRGTIRR